MGEQATKASNLSEEKRALLELRLKGVDEREEPTIPKRPPGAPAPLSFAQERLWFLELLVASTPVYHVLLPLRIVGELDVGALERTLGEIVRRHEVLRTRVQVVDGTPVQVVDEPRPVELPMRDLGHLPPAEREERALAAAAAAGRRPIDLERGPLLRAQLIRLDERDHVLALAFHHIATDGWSAGIFAEELAAVYDAFHEGRPSPLPELPIQYADYAVWQRERAEELEGQLEHWVRQLDGMPPLEYPADRPPPEQQTFRAGADARTLSPELTERLRSLSAGEQATLFMTLLTAFKVLLARHTGQEDVAVGMPVAGRETVELERLVGFFLNMLILRTDLSGNPTFRELLHRVRRVCVDALAHESLPFERLVQEIQPERSITRNAFTNVQVNFNPPRTRVGLAGLDCTELKLETGYAAYPLTLYFVEEEHGLRMELAYQLDLFSQERIAALLDEFELLLDEVASMPDAPIGSYSLVTTAARQVLPDPAERLERPIYEPVTELFRDWAARAPDEVAIRSPGGEVTYAVLLERSERIARTLRAAGVERGVTVGVGGAPSIGLIAGFFGVLLAGGVALPLDRALPTARQALMLSEAGATRVVAAGEDGAPPELLAEASGLDVLLVDPDTGLATDPAAEAADGEPPPPVDPEAPAYVYFTSGTTGTPKGVLGRHTTLAHMLDWERTTFDVGPGDRCGMTTRFSFDMVLRDVFLPLTSGGALVIPDDETIVLDAPRVLRWLEDEGITLLHIVPSLAQRWLENRPHDVTLPDLRCTFFAGEPLTEALVRRWRTAFPGAGVSLNFYGTTETMVRTCQRVPSEPYPGVQPVGDPLPHAQTLVLNAAGQLCGIGELGEVFLRSRICTYGYVNAPVEQAARFLPNPFTTDEDDVCYRTGDTGRYRCDGTVDVLGRRDHQVKIHGVRVEPVEIEAVLGTHPGVAACTVSARDDVAEDETVLVAYFVAEEDWALGATELRGYLAERLPESMVPRAYVALDALPLLSNGKVSRKELPPPTIVAPEEVQVEPRTPTERLVAEIWQDVLGLERVGLQRSFFDLGGHSLKVVDVIGRLREALDVDLPLRVLFEEPTVERLARAVDEWKQDADELGVVAGMTDELVRLAGEDGSIRSVLEALEALEREEA